MFSIKKMLVDLYDSRTAKSCSASIGDIMNLRRNVEHNQFLATIVVQLSRQKSKLFIMN